MSVKAEFETGENTVTRADRNGNFVFSVDRGNDGMVKLMIEQTRPDGRRFYQYIWLPKERAEDAAAMILVKGCER